MVLSADPQYVAAQNPDATRQLDALSPDVPKVEQDYVAPPLEARHMCVAEDDGVGLLATEQFSHIGTGGTSVE